MENNGLLLLLAVGLLAFALSSTVDTVASNENNDNMTGTQILASTNQTAGLKHEKKEVKVALKTKTASGGNLSQDYVEVENARYKASFKKNDVENQLLFQYADTSIVVKPKFNAKMKVKAGENTETITESAETIDSTKDSEENAITLEYEATETRLKEQLIILEKPYGKKEDLELEFSISPSTNIYISLDGKTEWLGDAVEAGGEIYFMRKRQAGIINFEDRLYKILKPYANDSKGGTLDLNYTLYMYGEEPRIKLTIPKDYLQKAGYPVKIDPTIEFYREDGWYRFANTQGCGTSPADCQNIIRNPSYPSDINFRILGGCSQDPYRGVQKDLFQFDVSPLLEYKGNLVYANLFFDGDCRDEYWWGFTYIWDFGLWTVDPVYSSYPSCEEDIFGKVRGDVPVKVFYGEGSGYSCIEGSLEAGITGALRNTLSRGESILAFKLDVEGELDDTADPGNLIAAPEYVIDKSTLYLEYAFDCSKSNDCPQTEYCSSAGYCFQDIEDGGYCPGFAIDNDDYACEHATCEYDNFDGGGYYCSDGTKCVNDGKLYDNGYKKCVDNTGYKQCQSGSWSEKTTCENGCQNNIGCVTTTTTTTTTTLQPPNLYIKKITIKTNN